MPGPSCPECGGNTRFNPSMKMIVCESCGLSFSRDEFEEMKRKLRKAVESYDVEEQQEKKVTKKRRRNDDYLDWWTSEHGE